MSAIIPAIQNPDPSHQSKKSKGGKKNQKSNPSTRAGARRNGLKFNTVENAPALATARDVTPNLIAHLAGRFSPEFIAGKIEELMGATHVTAGGKLIPDNRAREAGLRLLMAYLIGLPVQRQEIVQLNFDSLEELQRRAQQSPALRSAVAKILEPTPGSIQIDEGNKTPESDLSK